MNLRTRFLARRWELGAVFLMLLAAPQSGWSAEKTEGPQTGVAPQVGQSTPAPATGVATGTATKPTVTSPNEKGSAPTDKSRREDSRFYRYKLNIPLGTHIVSSVGAGLYMGGQGGMAPIAGRPFYIGPELDFTLFPSGYLVGLLASTWYEKRIQAAPRLSLALGAAIGPVFTSGITSLGGTTFAFLLDAVVAQEISEYATFRGQFRPGILGGYFSIMMNLSVSFRFL